MSGLRAPLIVKTAQYRNLKTSRIYIVVDNDALHVSNNVNELVVVYRELGGDRLYVRDKYEFLVKFEKVE